MSNQGGNVPQAGFDEPKDVDTLPFCEQQERKENIEAGSQPAESCSTQLLDRHPTQAVEELIDVSGNFEGTSKPCDTAHLTAQDNGTGTNSTSNIPPHDVVQGVDGKVADDVCTFPSGDVSTDNVPSPTRDKPKVSGYRLKRIQWHGRYVPIVTQNENGPCPLIAIANVLLLRGKIVIPTSVKVITPQELMEYVADCIMENTPKNLTDTVVLNYEQNMHDAIGVLPHLLTGLDVNIRFKGVSDFEYTPECIIFDLLNIPLYHGWLVDPQATEITEAIGNLGYNQLVEKIITNKSSTDENAVTKALIAESFLETTATQLTYHGLCELNTAMAPFEVAVLFRNNHFSTIYKRVVTIDDFQAGRPRLDDYEEVQLFQLVTDQGFLLEPRVAWETLSNIEGDGVFVDGNFTNCPRKHTHPAGLNAMKKGTSSSCQQINEDLELARRLHERDRRSLGSVPLHSNLRVRTPERRRWGDCCIL